MQTLLGYAKWERFKSALKRAKEACEQSGEEVENHFLSAGKMVDLGSGAQREVEDWLLTRYACYLTAQNGDPRKEEIAFAQSYFAIQTRRQELIETRLQQNERLKARKKLTSAEKELSRVIYERGVDQMGFARIRSRGDSTLFGGHTTEDMKNKLDVPKNRPLADFLPRITIAAKYFASEMTSFNVESKDLHGENRIGDEHEESNKLVRESLLKGGIKPEELPAEEDIKKVERRLKSSDKKLLKDESKSRTTKNKKKKD